MSPQDKATTERNAKTLRAFVKRPENKVCADCKRNDPRWASWNLGVYLCIRCSGIHRGMGTHISKVKSIDLDTWTPEQMQAIEKWGNRRANLYWEAHLKAGHVPPDHKMESFIRSKYETRRWALDGPPPSDPSILEDPNAFTSSQAAPAAPLVQPQSQAIYSSSQPSTSTSTSLSRTTASASPINRQPQPHQLLSTAVVDQRRQFQPPVLTPPGQTQAQAQQVAQQVAQQAKSPEPNDELFTLDFHAPSSGISNNAATAQQQQPKNVKQDILSLFSTPSSTSASAANPIMNAQNTNTNSAFGQFQSPPATSPSPWDSFGQAPQPSQPAQPTSMVGTNGTGSWGTSSGWTAPAPAPPALGNLWGNPVSTPVQPKQPDLFGGVAGGDIWGASSIPGGNVWGSTSANTNAGVVGGGGAGQKDDAFGDIWGGFK